MKTSKALATLSQEERDELIRIIKRDIEFVIEHNIPHLSEVNELPDSPIKAYIRLAKLEVAARNITPKIKVGDSVIFKLGKSYVPEEHRLTTRFKIMAINEKNAAILVPNIGLLAIEIDRLEPAPCRTSLEEVKMETFPPKQQEE